MKCEKCNNIIPDDSAFCNHCGTRIEKQQELTAPKCEKCGNTLPLDSEFCHFCGNKVNRPTNLSKCTKHKKTKKINKKKIAIIIGAIILAICFIVLVALLIPEFIDDNTPNTTTLKTEPKTEKWSSSIFIKDNINIAYDYYFKNVESFLYAVKRDPNKYNGTIVKVVGSIQTTINGDRLVDYTLDYIPSLHDSNGIYITAFNKLSQNLGSSQSKVNILYSDNAKESMVELGDLVKFYGIVYFINDELTLYGTYDLVATIEERAQNILNQK